VTHDSELPVVQSVATTAAKLRALGCLIVAVVPGAETGVLLADELASALGTRCNPLKLSLARRNKCVAVSARVVYE